MSVDPDASAYSRLVGALGDLGTVTENNGAARAKCPAHNGNSDTSLAIRPIDGSVLVYCHAGCATVDVLAALQLKMCDLFDGRNGATYDYPDGRRVHRSPTKQFHQSGNTKGQALFHADRIGDAETVYVPEGEKDVLAIETIGAIAVCSAMGAGKADRFDWSPLENKHVIVIADDDEPGRQHARQVATLLTDVAASVEIKRAAVGKDAADHVAAARTLDELEALPEQDGAELLDAVHGALTCYVIFANEHQPVAVTLWIASTHGLQAWQHATRLALTSPQKRCGKSRLLDIIAGLAFSSLLAVNATTAAIYRSIGDNDAKAPTLLIDEADALFGTKHAADQNEDLRALLNAGWQRDRPAWRCVGPQQIPTPFNTFAMAALAAIRRLPDTIADRAVGIDLKRRGPGEQVARFRLRRDGKRLAELRDQLSCWVRARIVELTEAEPEIPESIEDRAADAWEPLIAVADAAGGDWPDRARAACVALSGSADSADEELGTVLLEDIRQIFDDSRDSFLASSALVGELRKREESPWSEYELTPSKLAKLLKPYGVRPDHNPAKTTRGYDREWFTDTFRRYIRPKVSSRPEKDSDQPEQPQNQENPKVSGSVRKPSETISRTPSDTLGTPPDTLDKSAIPAAQGNFTDTWTPSDTTPGGNGSKGAAPALGRVAAPDTVAWCFDCGTELTEDEAANDHTYCRDCADRRDADARQESPTPKTPEPPGAHQSRNTAPENSIQGPSDE